MILSTCPFGLFPKKQPRDKEKGRFQMLYGIIIWFWSEMYFRELKKKNQQKKGSSLTGILYKICRKIQQQQKTQKYFTDI